MGRVDSGGWPVGRVSGRVRDRRGMGPKRREPELLSRKRIWSFPMQMIEAIIKPHKIDTVKHALARLGILGVTAIECKGFGRQMGHTERYRGAKMDVGFVPKGLLKICVKSEDVDKAVNAIVEAGRTGEVGDGKIFVHPISRVIRIRTGETNEQAL